MSLFLLTPSPVVNQIMEYSIAWAARDRGIRIHAVSVESNHFHIVLTDVEGKLSQFMQELNRSAARGLLEYYRSRFPDRRFETVWTNGRSFSGVVLLTPNAIIDELVYTLTNPVKDGLVRDYRKWPGFNTRPSDWRVPKRTVRRPDYYFKKTPQELTYEVTAPSQLGDALENVIATVELHIRNAQQQASVDLAAQGRNFVGVNGVLSADPFDAPTTPRIAGNLNPHLAAGGDSKALSIAKQALKLFRRAYREAWQALKRGAQAVFPGGTHLMRIRFGQRCESLDACWCVLAT